METSKINELTIKLGKALKSNCSIEFSSWYYLFDDLEPINTKTYIVYVKDKIRYFVTFEEVEKFVSQTITGK